MRTMSCRHIRKIYGPNVLPLPEGNSDEEYEPFYAKKSSKNKFDGLELSSHSESEHDTTDAVANENTQQVESIKKKKKKKKQRKPKQTAKSRSKENLEVNEIEECVNAVDAIIDITTEASVSAGKSESDPAKAFMLIQQKHLNVANELKRMFGPEAIEPENRRGRQHDMYRLLKKAAIVPLKDYSANFKKVGLSMSVERRENGCTYFTFDHNREYQNLHRSFLQVVKYTGSNLLVPLEFAHKSMHVEGLLETTDSMFRLEEYTTANNLLEQAISYMQYVAHPSFNLMNNKIRLEYKYPENRPFHIAVLKYLHLLTNRACHRTALELAKLLLNLDPSDPLAILLIIDTLALRAREHQWLIDAIDYWSKEREAGLLLNIQYSYAMAHFHVATKQKTATTTADKLLQDAMMRFPTVVMKIMECAGYIPNANLQNHPLFTSKDNTPRKLKDLILLYAKFTWSKWREPAVFDWLNKNAQQLADKYNNDVCIQEQAKQLGNECLNLFRDWPEEVIRYLSIIKPMADLIVDGAVPRIAITRSSDPFPPANTIYRYDYDKVTSDNTSISHSRNSMLYEIFVSFLPGYLIAVPTELERNVIQRYLEAMELVARQGYRNYVEIDQIVAEAEDNDLVDDNNAPAPIENENEAHGENQNDAGDRLSVGALARAVRRFMNVNETQNNQEENNVLLRNQRSGANDQGSQNEN